MNNKITFPRLATLLADKSGKSKRFSEDFLRELFSLIAERLEAGENVKVKGLGSFRLSKVEARKSVDVTTGMPMEIAGHTKVVFTPAKELAEAINAPFEAFSAIEITDDINIDEIANESEIEVADDSEEINISDSSELQIETTVGSEPPEAAVNADEIPAIDEEQPEEEDVADEIPAIDEEQPEEEGDDGIEDREELAEDNDSNDASIDIEESTEAPKIKIHKQSDTDDNDFIIIEGNRGSESSGRDAGRMSSTIYDDSTKSNWKRIVLISLCCAALGIILTFAVWSILTKPEFSNQSEYGVGITENVNDIPDQIPVSASAAGEQEIGFSDTSETAAEEEIEAIPDKLEEVPTQPSDAVVYDTIGTSRYLTTMAKAHYGNNKFWPYIYEENKSRIGHPDKIRPGTAIIIPKLSKYGVDPRNPKDEEKATKLGVEIYARYGKKIN